MKKQNLVFYFFCVASLTVKSQSVGTQVVNAAGGSAETNGLSVEWSIGELAAVNKMDARDGKVILTNGFVQPMQNTFNDLATYVSLAKIRIYPNPTIDILEVDFLENITGKITIQLSSSIGRILYTNELSFDGSGYIEKINMKNLPKGTYLLYIQRIIPGSGEYEPQPAVYKIIKL